MGRPRATPTEASARPADAPAPTANWLGHLVERRREGCFVEAITEPKREDDDDAIVELLREHIARLRS